MAYTTINKPGLHFNTKLYAGNSSTQSISGVGFQPDWVWIKDRDNASRWHQLFDAVRGAGKVLYSNDAAQQGTDNTRLSGFASDGFSLGNSANVNNNGNNYASWNWKANGAGSSNSDGDITSTVSVNTTSGFSIVKYTGTGANATIGHGLGVVPKMIIVKAYEGGQQWAVQHSALGATKGLRINTNAAAYTSSTRWNNTEPTSSVFTVGTEAEVNTNTEDHIAYCFAEKTGFSKFGSFIGNGYANGTFVYTGFKPAFVINKRTDSTANWLLIDNKREGFNPDQDDLRPNLPNAEGSDETFDFLSNGFKVRTTSNDFGGGSGATYIFMAFAEEPLVGTNNVPATAR